MRSASRSTPRASASTSKLAADRARPRAAALNAPPPMRLILASTSRLSPRTAGAPAPAVRRRRARRSTKPRCRRSAAGAGAAPGRAKALAVATRAAGCLGDRLRPGRRTRRPAAGQAGSREAAIAQLPAMSGRDVAFHTAVVPAPGADGRVRTRIDTTTVRFRTLSRRRDRALRRCRAAVRLRRQLQVRRPGHHPVRGASNRSDPTALVGLPLIATARLLRRRDSPCPERSPASSLSDRPSIGLLASSPRRCHRAHAGAGRANAGRARAVPASTSGAETDVGMLRIGGNLPVTPRCPDSPGRSRPWPTDLAVQQHVDAGQARRRP